MSGNKKKKKAKEPITYVCVRIDEKRKEHLKEHLKTKGYTGIQDYLREKLRNIEIESEDKK